MCKLFRCEIRFRLTGWEAFSRALRAACHAHVLVVGAVVAQPLPSVAQHHAGLLPCAAHVIQQNGTRPHPEAWARGDVEPLRKQSHT